MIKLKLPASQAEMKYQKVPKSSVKNDVMSDPVSLGRNPRIAAS